MNIDVIGVGLVSSLLADINNLRPVVTYRAINKTLDKGKTLVSKRVREQAALKAAYVGSRLTLEKANLQKQNGRIKAEKRGILLSRFDPKRLTLKAKSPIAKLRGYGALSDGSANIAAIAAGRKIKSMSYKIKPSGGRKNSLLFPMRLRNSNAIGLAVRTGAGKRDYKVLYGPSVSQIFNTLKPEIEDALSVEYVAQFASQLDYELAKLRR